MVKYQFGFEHLNKVYSQNQIGDDDCVEMEVACERRTIPNEAFPKEKVKTPSVSQIHVSSNVFDIRPRHFPN